MCCRQALSASTTTAAAATSMASRLSAIMRILISAVLTPVPRPVRLADFVCACGTIRTWLVAPFAMPPMWTVMIP